MRPYEEELFGKTSSECVGCAHITGVGCCEVYTQPDRQHSRIDGCSMRTHNKPERKIDPKLNPLKASKRGVKQ